MITLAGTATFELWGMGCEWKPFVRMLCEPLSGGDATRLVAIADRILGFAARGGLDLDRRFRPL